MSDEDLIARCLGPRSRNQRAFDLLIQRYQGRVLANCRYLCGSASEAEDLAQEVFVKAYFALPKFEQRSTFSTWLYRIKANHCINHNEKRDRRRHIDLQLPEETSTVVARVAPTGIGNIVSDERRSRIEAVLDTMNDTLRIPLLLRDADGLSYDEIAEVLELSLSAVKMRINRGRREFRRLYRELDVYGVDRSITEEPDK
jgi:RNA polymerase sigma-70 factor (ECF subfamily)